MTDNKNHEDRLLNRERIFTPVVVQVRMAPDGTASRSIGGYANEFNKLSENLGGFVERVAPSMWNKSRADGWPDVIARYNHDDSFLLGATRNGTLKLSIDETGLNYTCDLPRSREDVLELVTRGDIDKSSFAFQTFEDDWGLSEQGYPLRTLVSGRLIDVAPVSTPAYRDSSVGMRSLAKKMDAELDDIVTMAKSDELRKLFTRTDNNGAPVKAKPTTFGPAARMALLAKKAKPISQ